jgi:hypothetical protein
MSRDAAIEGGRECKAGKDVPHRIARFLRRVPAWVAPRMPRKP